MKLPFTNKNFINSTLSEQEAKLVKQGLAEAKGEKDTHWSDKRLLWRDWTHHTSDWEAKKAEELNSQNQAQFHAQGNQVFAQASAQNQNNHPYNPDPRFLQNTKLPDNISSASKSNLLSPQQSGSAQVQVNEVSSTAGSFVPQAQNIPAYSFMQSYSSQGQNFNQGHVNPVSQPNTEAEQSGSSEVELKHSIKSLISKQISLSKVLEATVNEKNILVEDKADTDLHQNFLHKKMLNSRHFSEKEYDAVDNIRNNYSNFFRKTVTFSDNINPKSSIRNEQTQVSQVTEYLRDEIYSNQSKIERIEKKLEQYENKRLELDRIISETVQEKGKGKEIDTSGENLFTGGSASDFIDDLPMDYNPMDDIE